MTPLQTAIAKLQTLEPDAITPLDASDAADGPVHQWSTPEVRALTLALAARRPLLVRGEPGTGKTQLASAVSHLLGWRLHPMAVTARTEARDLVYEFDAVRRLGDAQSGVALQERDYWEPGPLWRAFDWASAQGYGTCRDDTAPAPAGHVVLIDEIDKADSDLPNSLLDLLGQRRLVLPGLRKTIDVAKDAQPLVLFTTNEERQLPPAFVRRCVVLNLEPDPQQSYTDWLVGRGRAHFGAVGARTQRISQRVLEAAAHQLDQDRMRARHAQVQAPGLAEYIDLLSALHELAPGDDTAQWQWLRELNAYVYLKAGVVDDVPDLSQQRRATALES